MSAVLEPVGHMRFGRLRRREFITLIGGAAAWPLGARAQQGERVRRIGVVFALPESDLEGRARLVAFVEGLQKLGWTEGQNVRIDHRWGAPDAATLQRLAKELVALKPDVIVTHTTPATIAVQQETRETPIVFVQVADPVGSGFVASLPKPLGNLTGFINLEETMGGKWLELLKEVAPRVARVALVFNPSTASIGGSYFSGSIKAAAASFAVEAISAPVYHESEFNSVFEAQAREPQGGVIVLPDIFTTHHRAELVSLAARHRIPTVYPFRYFAELGGLLSYGNDPVDLFRRAAEYVDRILHGAKASELPVQVPTKFELVINLKTAKALGLTVPPMLLATADEVIE